METRKYTRLEFFSEMREAFCNVGQIINNKSERVSPKQVINICTQFKSNDQYCNYIIYLYILIFFNEKYKSFFKKTMCV